MDGPVSTDTDRSNDGRFASGNQFASGRRSPLSTRARAKIVTLADLQRAVSTLLAGMSAPKAETRIAAATALLKLAGMPLPQLVELEPPPSTFDPEGRLTAAEQETLRALILKAKAME